MKKIYQKRGSVVMAEEKKKTTSREEFDDEALAMLGLDGGGAKPKPKKPVFYFQDAGLVIPIWAVLTLERSIMWVQTPTVHPMYGIVINKGMEPSQSCPIGEKSMWYEKEEIAEQKFNLLVEEMNSTAFKVIKV